MDEILNQAIKLIPGISAGQGALGILLIAAVGRSVKALREGDGLLGVWRSLWYGKSKGVEKKEEKV